VAASKKKPGRAAAETAVLFFSVFVVGLCTIIYELLIGSVSSYFLGDSIKQFSLTIGMTMSAMGLGTYFSRFIVNNLVLKFIFVEGILGLVGGLSVPVLYGVYAAEIVYYPVMILFILAIGFLIGLEIPLLTRIMVKYYPLRENISNILSLDYLGALFASALFPFILLPVFGLFQSSIITGSLNVLVAAFTLNFFRSHIGVSRLKSTRNIVYAVLGVLLVFFLAETRLMRLWENSMYEDRVILSKQTKYQKIVVTRHKGDLRLYLDGNLQFSSIDESRYHEALVHVPMSAARQKKSILVLGGGDGLAIREILKYPEVENITLVDLDEEMTALASRHRDFIKVNQGSLSNPRVRIVHEDAFVYLTENSAFFDVIIADLPDPRNTSLGRLYSREFYRVVKKRLSREGIFVTQATSPYFARKAFWCIFETARSAGFTHASPYHVEVPSFGDWGFVLAATRKINLEEKLNVETRFLTGAMLKTVFEFSKDIEKIPVKSSGLNNPEILNYYLEGWEYWF